MSAATAMISSEAKLLLRNPGVVLWTVVLPVVAAVVLGALPATNSAADSLDGLSFFQVFQPVLVLFAVALLAVTSLPDVLTRYREMGVLKRLRTTPASPALLLSAQLVLTTGVALLCAVLMVVVPTFFGAPWPQNPAGFLIAFLLTVWAMLGIGLVIASLFRNAKVAAGFGTLLFFVLQFFAGLWVQRPLMPGWLRTVSDFTPSGAGVQALTDSGAGQWPAFQGILVLLAWGIVTSLVAARVFKWE